MLLLTAIILTAWMIVPGDKPGAITALLVSPSTVTAGATTSVTIAGSGTCGELSLSLGTGRPMVLTNVDLPHAIAHVYPEAGRYALSVTGAGNAKHCTGSATSTINVQRPAGSLVGVSLAPLPGTSKPDPGHEPTGVSLSPTPVPRDEPIVLASAYYFYPATNDRVDAFRTNAQWKLPLTDGITTGFVYFTWKVPDVTPTDLAAVVQNPVCCAKIQVNGVLAQAKWMLIQYDATKDGNLTAQLTGFDVASGGWPRTVKITVTAGGKTRSSIFTPVYAGPMVGMFQTLLDPAFHHARCTTCHDMGSGPAIVARHLAAGVGVSATVQPQDTNPCWTCHQPPVVSDWRSPFFAQGIQWSTMTASQICLTVKSKLPTTQQTWNHFHLDPRVKWAVSSGVTPYGKKLPTAPPGSMAGFLNVVDAWIAAGRPCPP
jgi:hypothetical protein